jgi:hypothetical protein
MLRQLVRVNATISTLDEVEVMAADRCFFWACFGARLALPCLVDLIEPLVEEYSDVGSSV